MCTYYMHLNGDYLGNSGTIILQESKMGFVVVKGFMVGDRKSEKASLKR